MGYNKLKRQFKTGDFSQAFHFYGVESYLKNYYLNELIKRLIGDRNEFDLVRFDGEGISGEEVMSAVYTPPLTGSTKLLVLRETGIFAAGASGRGMWKEVFSTLPDYLYIIACEDKFDRRSAAYKAFSSVSLSVDFKSRGRGDIKAWVSKILGSNKKSMKVADLEYFLDLTGVDMNHVMRQLEKLLAAAAKRNEITRKDIDSLVSATLFTKEYLWTDAMLRRERQKSMTALYELFELRREPIVLLYILSSAFLSTYRAGVLIKSKRPLTAKSLGVPQEFMANKYAQLARGCGSEFLRRSVDLIKEADYDIKVGRMEPQTGIVTLCAEILNTPYQ